MAGFETGDLIRWKGRHGIVIGRHSGTGREKRMAGHLLVFFDDDPHFAAILNGAEEREASLVLAMMKRLLLRSMAERLSVQRYIYSDAVPVLLKAIAREM